MSNKPELIATNARIISVTMGRVDYEADGVVSTFWPNRPSPNGNPPAMPEWTVDIWEDEGIRFVPHYPVESTQLDELSVVSVGDFEAVIRHRRNGFISGPESVPAPLPSVVRQLREHIGQQVVGVMPVPYGIGGMTLLRLANQFELAIYARGGKR